MTYRPYKGFEISFVAKTGRWLANRPTDLLVADGFQARNARDLKTLIDCHTAGF
jgi:hypothetical protein